MDLKLMVDKRKAYIWDINGPIEAVYYYKKSIAHFTVKGKEYESFHLIWRSNMKFDVGDTIIKKHNSYLIKLIKKNTTDTLSFGNEE
ncbi:hypothetical protein [Mucilaginibacter conchicola]|nr:hypothetical protein [Mucilaginibacter conchicola]